jgi:curved DNA-binding protein CbpA
MKFCPILVVTVSIGNILSMFATTCLKVATTGVPVFPVADARKAPELTSTALKVHKVYTIFPPHDTDLYDIMEVSPNATLAEITRSYRKLSRQYHPDKQGRRQQQQQPSQQNSRMQMSAGQRLQQIRTAYEILSDDSKRLPYHRYGLIDPDLAAFLLLGPRVSPTNYFQLLQQQRHSHSGSFSGSSYDHTVPLFDKLDRELLHLMGYDDSTLEVLAWANEAAYIGDGTDPAVVMEEHRINTVAALLIESIRPLVEGRLDSRLYAHLLTQDCDRWKRLPLGAQIIRSVGRAYRHEGREFLQRYKNSMNSYSWNNEDDNADKENYFSTKQMVLQLQTDLSIGFRRRWRSTKDILEAAAVSGRLAMAERSFQEQERKRKQQKLEKERRKKKAYESIAYGGGGFDPSNSDTHLPQMDDFIWDGDEENLESLDDLEEEQRELERLKAQQSLLQTLQIEALWKVCKIDLDRVVRRASAMILSGEYFFYPSHQSSSGYYADSVGSSHGWVTSSGRTMDSERAKVAAAEAMILTGEIMVQQSKEGTSWKQ